MLILFIVYANFIYRSVEDRNKTHKNSILVKKNKSTVKPYGSDSRDFGNLEYSDYLKEIENLMKKNIFYNKTGRVQYLGYKRS